MLEWQEWITTDCEDGMFPCLRELHIRRCPRLKRSLPKCLPPSTSVEISECPELVVTLPILSVAGDLKLLDSNMVQLRSDHEHTHVFQRESSRLLTNDPMNAQFSQGSLQDISSFESLKVSEISQLMRLPPNLRSLKIEGCETLNSIPGRLMLSNPHLRHLYIINCRSLEFFHGSYRPTALKTLYIRNCRKLQFILPPVTIDQYPLLEHLCIGSSCDSLRCLPLSYFPKLRNLAVWDCANFRSLINMEDHLSLDSLEIRDCPKLKSCFEEGLRFLRSANLKSILLSNCRTLKVLPDQLHRLTSLQSLFVNECPELASISEGVFPSNLGSLCIISCHKLTPCIEWGLQKLEHLSRFEIEGGCRDLESFPENELLPSSLNSLRISRLSNLKFLDYKGLQHLTCLETLQINCCDKLQSLPEEGLPSSLTFLDITECTSLKSKLQNKRGKDWYRIAHIPHIQIDEEVFS